MGSEMKLRLNSSLFALALALSPFIGESIACAQAETLLRDRAGNPAYYSSGAPISSPSLKPTGASAVALRVRQATSLGFVPSANQFFSNNASQLGISDPLNSLQRGSSLQDAAGNTHVRYRQLVQGLPVLGGEAVLHFNSSDALATAELRTFPNLAVSTTSQIAAELARQYAVSAWQNDFNSSQPPSVESVNLMVVPDKLLAGNLGSGAQLAWEVSLSSETPPSSENYYVSASNGVVILKLTKFRSLNRKVPDCAMIPGTPNCYLDWQPAGQSYYYGRSEPIVNPRGPYPQSDYPLYFGSIDVDQTWSLLGNVSSYWSTNFGRNGANNLGGTLVASPTETLAFVHTDNINAANCQSALAWWSPSPGRLNICRKMASPDVIGHEYTHGVVFYAITNGGQPAGTIFTGETGALEESFADLNGAGVERAVMGSYDWQEGLWQSTPAGTYPSSGFGLIRNLSSPRSQINQFLSPNIAFPERYTSPTFYCGTQDLGGVHHNSTVPSFAMYLAAQGGEYNGCEIHAVGLDAVLQILYRAWTAYFTRTHTFALAYQSFNDACSSLYGVSNPQYCVDLNKALQAVGMDRAGGCGGAPESAPLCAHRNAGDIFATRPDTYLTTTIFAPNESLNVRGNAGISSKTVDIYVLPHQESRAAWSDIVGTPIASATVRQDGAFDSWLMSLTSVGSFDIVVDGNRDKSYQPWADSITTFEVQVPKDGDGVCYQGESRSTSENCMTSPSDCGCRTGTRCQDMACPGSISPSGPLYACAPIPRPGSHVKYCLAE